MDGHIGSSGGSSRGVSGLVDLGRPLVYDFKQILAIKPHGPTSPFAKSRKLRDRRTGGYSTVLHIRTHRCYSLARINLRVEDWFSTLGRLYRAARYVDGVLFSGNGRGDALGQQNRQAAVAR